MAKKSTRPTTEANQSKTMQQIAIGQLRQADGAIIAKIVDATAWQPHTVRCSMSGALRKKLGWKMTFRKVVGRKRIYPIPV